MFFNPLSFLRHKPGHQELVPLLSFTEDEVPEGKPALTSPRLRRSPHGAHLEVRLVLITWFKIGQKKRQPQKL